MSTTAQQSISSSSNENDLSPAQKKSIQMIMEMDRYLVASDSDVGQRLKDLEAPHDRLFPFCLYNPQRTTVELVKKALQEKVKKAGLIVETPQQLCKASYEVVSAYPQAPEVKGA